MKNVLQIGHLWFLLIHLFKHLMWKMWLHFKVYIFSLFLKSSKQIKQLFLLSLSSDTFLIVVLSNIFLIEEELILFIFSLNLFNCSLSLYNLNIILISLLLFLFKLLIILLLLLLLIESLLLSFEVYTDKSLYIGSSFILNNELLTIILLLLLIVWPIDILLFNINFSNAIYNGKFCYIFFNFFFNFLFEILIYLF